MNNVITNTAGMWFIIGIIGTYVFGSKKKGHEGKFVPNMVIVKNTSECLNVCYHIHHWIWMLIVMIFVVIIDTYMVYTNYVNSSINYTNMISLYLGASISEYIRYGNDIFKVKQKCFTNCSLNKIR
jgi:hypothetical protein